MILVISPAKALDYETPPTTATFTQPDLLDHAAELIAVLHEKSPAEIAELMSLSDPLSSLNVARYANWSRPFDPGNAKQALSAPADQSRTLLGWGFGSFEKISPIAANAVVTSAKVNFGKANTVAAGLGVPWLVTVPRGQQQVQTTVEVTPNLQAPIAKGAVVGKVIATSNGKPAGETPLVAQVEVERAGLLLRGWQHVTQLFGK